MLDSQETFFFKFCNAVGQDNSLQIVSCNEIANKFNIQILNEKTGNVRQDSELNFYYSIINNTIIKYVKLLWYHSLSSYYLELVEAYQNSYMCPDIYTYYKTKSSAASICLSVCLSVCTRKTRKLLHGFSWGFHQ